MIVRRHAATSAALVAAGMGAIAAAGIGAIAAWHYHRLGLTLSHYDSRGHLVVARRIFDSITPGWQQIGAVWLPLPHLLNALPVQNDLLYRTGASAVAMSIAAFAAATGTIAWTVAGWADSIPAAAVGAAVFALNPNVLYLQGTPMTEPLLLALLTGGIALVTDPSARKTTAGILLALACLTRYEAWPVTAVALGAAFLAQLRCGRHVSDAIRDVGRVALYPAIAVVGFSMFSRVVVGAWFVSTDFFVPENKALHDGLMAAKEIAWGTAMLSGTVLTWIGAAGAVLVLTRSAIDRGRARWLPVAALAATAAVPWAAFYEGHPFRIRYMVPLIVIEAIGCGVAAGALGRLCRSQVAGAAVILGIVAWSMRPLDGSAPMVIEAQWDRPNVAARAAVTACLDPPGRGEKVMASMGSLGHYMQEAAAGGYHIRDFLHEGNGDIWLAALERPLPYADWVMIEEKAQGGDMLARRAREHPQFLDGYSRVCDGAGLALYRRQQ